MPPVLETLNRVTHFLKTSQIEEARQNAELILWHVLELRERAELYLNRNQTIPECQEQHISKLAHQRAQGIPLQYLLGTAEFFSLPFHVEPGGLIPRPETELLVEQALRWMEPLERVKILDIGTGSGNIAISIAKNFQTTQILATDISQDALKISEKNVCAHNVSSQIELQQSDLFGSLDSKDKFDMIISNPPYIDEKDLNHLPLEIRQHEPLTALDGGKQGLEIISRLIEGSPEFLRPGGTLFLEFGGSKQTKNVLEMMSKTGAFEKIEILKDYHSRDRMLKALRK